MKKKNKDTNSRASFVHCWTIIFHVVPIVCIVCSFLTEPSKNGIIISIHHTNLMILHKDRSRVKRFWISLKLNLDKQEALKIEMLTTDWPAAQSRWAWPGRQSRYRGYIWAGWPTTWTDASAKEGSRTPRILLQGCSASPPADGERENMCERSWKRSARKDGKRLSFSFSHPELRPRFLHGFSRRVQCSPLVCQLSSPPLPPLQEQSGPHHVKQCKHHAADVTARLGKKEKKTKNKNKHADALEFSSWWVQLF